MSNGRPLDPYAVLGVARTASEDEIRRAYRKLARKHHPDVNPGNREAEEQFKQITAAYEVLGDAAKRKAFDEFGPESTATGFDPDKARQYRQWRESRARTGHPFDGETFDFDLGDLFGGGVGGGGPGGFGGGAARSRGPRRGQDVRAAAELDFATALRGSQVEVNVPIEEDCRRCGGSGVSPGKSHRCAACDGTGQRRVAQGPLRMVTPCEQCGGSGETGPACEQCGGAGAVSAVRKTRIRIPPGAEDGDTLRIAGKGASGRGGGPPGDLLILIRVEPHPRVTREGLDLRMKLPVTLDEAYNGAAIEVPTFSGPVSMKIPPRSQSGTKLRLRGKGVARGKNKGDMILELEVVLPARHDPALADALRAASELYDGPVRKEIAL